MDTWLYDLISFYICSFKASACVQVLDWQDGLWLTGHLRKPVTKTKPILKNAEKPVKQQRFIPLNKTVFEIH